MSNVLEDALEAINRVHEGPTSNLVETHDRLLAIREELDVMIEAVEEDLQP